ncbi:MAG: glycosyltransferase family 39 protein [Pseudomonadota bacterium]|nr:glycosyltransferase family 39 protein [Pseudomonadota bacterium]
MTEQPYSAWRKSSAWEIIALLIPLCGIAISLFLLLRGIAAPWNGYGDSDGALFGSIARNYLQFGVFDLKFGQLVTYEEITRPVGFYYLHHPPLFPLLVMLSVSLFGDMEMNVRLVSVLATLATMAVLFVLLRKTVSAPAAVYGVFLFASYPSTIFFGRKPGYEALTLFFVILAVWLYRNYNEGRRPGALYLLLGALAAGAASDWAAYLLPLALFFHHLISRNHRPLDRRLLAGLAIVPAGMLLLFLFSIYLVDKASVLDLLHQGLAYTGLYSQGGAVAQNIIEAKIDFSASEYVFRLVKNYDSAFGLVSALLALIGLLYSARFKEARYCAFALLFVALGTFIVFWRSLYFHLWWLHLLAAPLAMLGAVAINGIVAGAKAEGFASSAAARALLIGALAMPVVVGMLYNARQIGGEQVRVLPEQYPEKPDFIRELGRGIGGLTSAGDQVMTNLTQIKSSIANPYSRILPYYSRRIIVSGITNPNEVQRQFDLSDQMITGGRYFLLFAHQQPDAAELRLSAWLEAAATRTPLKIQGHSLYLYKLENDIVQHSRNRAHRS